MEGYLRISFWGELPDGTSFAAASDSSCVGEWREGFIYVSRAGTNTLSGMDLVPLDPTHESHTTGDTSLQSAARLHHPLEQGVICLRSECSISFSPGFSGLE